MAACVTPVSSCVTCTSEATLVCFSVHQEIARFMQKQEIKSKRRSRELEGPASWREHRAMISHHDRRAARERQVNESGRLTLRGFPYILENLEDGSPIFQSYYYIIRPGKA